MLCGSLDGRRVWRRMDTFIYGWVLLLFIWDDHNIVNPLYPYTKSKVFLKNQFLLFVTLLLRKKCRPAAAVSLHASIPSMDVLLPGGFSGGTFWLIFSSIVLDTRLCSKRWKYLEYLCVLWHLSSANTCTIDFYPGPRTASYLHLLMITD